MHVSDKEFNAQVQNLTANSPNGDLSRLTGVAFVNKP
jgi:hypothetical protein